MRTEIENNIKMEMQNKELNERILNYAKSLTNCLCDAEDLVQYSRQKVREKRETIERKNIGGLLTTIIRNQYINQYRKKKKYPHSNIQDNSQRDSIYQGNNRNEIESDFAVKTIQDGLQCISKKRMDTLNLYIQGKKYEEIAEELDIPLGTVKARIFYARIELASYLSTLDPAYKVRQKKSTAKEKEEST